MNVNGADLVEGLRSELPDVSRTCGLAGDGPDFGKTKTIRKLEDPNKYNIPIVALTAFAQSEIQDSTKPYKMDGYMTKPFDPRQLFDLLKFYSRDRLDVG